VLGLLGFPPYRKAAGEAIEKARFWLEKINLVSRADDPAGDLPYGAQRRLEIARAMCTEPELLCLDEPAAGLNARESAELNKLLLDIRADTGTSILLIEHDMSVVMEISDHVVVLEYGTKISDGTPESVRNDPKVIAAYHGVEDEEVVELIEKAEEAGVDDIIAAVDMLSTEALHEIEETHPDATPVELIPASTLVQDEPAEAPPAKQAVTRTAAAKPAASAKAAGIKAGATSNALAEPRGGKPDKLVLIKGIGPVNERKLNEHGIFHFDQIAAWKKADIVAAEAYLDFDGRIAREDWIGQAKKLAKESQAKPAPRKTGGAK